MARGRTISSFGQAFGTLSHGQDVTRIPEIFEMSPRSNVFVMRKRDAIFEMAERSQTFVMKDKAKEN